MKKTLFLGIIAASLGFTACSSEDDAILGENTQKKGMVLNATVEQSAETRAEISTDWKFAFTSEENILVTNTEVTSGTYYTFTNDGTEFKSTDATPTASDADWYAYYPSNTISLTGQTGTLAGAASLYALAGATAETTGASGLNITMKPQVAIVKINNVYNMNDHKLHVKTGPTDYLTGLTANGAGFDVATSTTESFLTGTYQNPLYFVLPAGVQLSIKDTKGAIVKSTGPDGLTAGKYYELTAAQTTFSASAGDFSLIDDNKTLTATKDGITFSATITTSGEYVFDYDGDDMGYKVYSGGNEALNDVLVQVTVSGKKCLSVQVSELDDRLIGDGPWTLKYNSNNGGWNIVGSSGTYRKINYVWAYYIQ